VSTINQYNIAITEGLALMDKIKKSKTYKNIMNYGQRAMQNFETALDIARKHGPKDKIDYIHQYLCVLNTYMGDAEKNEKNVLEAIKYYSEALKQNDMTKANDPMYKRKAMINHTLMALSVITEKLDYALSFANQTIEAASKVKDQPDFSFDYMMKVEPVIMKAGTSLDKEYLYNSVYKLRKTKNIDEALKANVLVAYAHYLFAGKLEVKKSIKMLNEARKSSKA